MLRRQLDKLGLRLRSLVHSGRVDRDLTREIRAHLEEETAANVARGMSEELGRAEALKAFGSAASVAEYCRDTRRVSVLSNLVQDARYAGRAFFRQPGVFASAALSMSLGIGAVLTVCSLANSLLLAKPTADDADRLVVIRMNNGSHVSYQSWRALSESDALGGVAGYRFEQSVNWRLGDDSAMLLPLLVTANFFDVVRVPVALGRGFTAAEARADIHPRLAVVSHEFWERRLGGDPGVIGRTLVINGDAYLVTGVLQRDLQAVTGFGIAPEVYLPLSPELYPALDQAHSGAAQLIGRLRPGQTLDAGRAALQAVVARLAETAAKPPFKAVSEFAPVGGLARAGELPGIGAFFLVLVAMSGLVLAIACANVAGLLLARGITRRREISMRIALGASRRRLVQQLVTESLIVIAAGVAGAVVLMLLAFVGLSRISLPVPIPVELHFTLDWRMVSVAAGVLLFSTGASGLLPALQTTRPALAGALKATDLAAGRRITVRGALLTGQVAVSTVLLVAALLFVRSLGRAAAIDPGFDVDRLVVAQVSFVEGRQGTAARPSIEEMTARVRAVAGVEAAAFSQGVPLTVFSGSTTGTDFQLEGRTGLTHVDFDGNRVGPSYFTTMGIPVLRGREFSAADRAGASAVVINDAFARRYLPGENPVGRTMSDPNRPGSTVQIIGVVANSKYHTLAETDRAAVYEPALADPTPDRLVHVVLRTSGAAGTVMTAVRRALLEMDNSVSVAATPMRRAVAFAVLPSRMGSIFLGLLGGVGVALAMVGLFGVVSFAVGRRSSEIAVRMALGASRGDVLSLVLQGASTFVIAGLALGLAMAWFITAPLTAFLVAGLSATDPVSFGMAGLLILAGSLAAVWVPAKRAIRIAPAIALKAE